MTSGEMWLEYGDLASPNADVVLAIAFIGVCAWLLWAAFDLASTEQPPNDGRDRWL